MEEITRTISLAIKEAKWLAIDYVNQSGEETSYWFAIKDINVDRRVFIGEAFNIAKMSDDSSGLISNAKIYFDGIKNVTLIDHTTYNRPDSLIEKIEKNIKNLSWLKYDFYDNNILEYFKQAFKYDNVPYQTETTLVKGIDEDVLNNFKTTGKCALTSSQIGTLIEGIKKLDLYDKSNRLTATELAFNLLSINVKDKGLFVCAYKRVFFDPETRELVLGEETLFNYEFASDNKETYKHNLRNYLDVEIDDFTTLFLKNPKEARDMLAPTLKKYVETLDERPYFFELVRSYNQYIEREFNAITEAYENETLSLPLKAFFGNNNKTADSRAHMAIVLLDKLNVDQLRVLYNALVQPITYVQGPPGTGKTYSILNLLISAFFNEQTVLVSSQNNKPIDDIIKKLMTYKSREIPIPLPVLRLGNIQKVRSTLLQIKEYINKYDRFTPDDIMLDKIVKRNSNNIKNVGKILKEHEERLDLEEKIEVLQSMNALLSTQLSMSIAIQADLATKTAELSTLRKYTDDEVRDLCLKAESDFFSWLFFTSVKRIKKLKEPKYKKFIDILNIEDESEQVGEFNSYIQKLDNLLLLQKVFPIIFTTNQSAWRVGPPTQTFDLTIMDEAGQCPISYSLFPIIRGKRLLLVGDPNQLQPVVTISPEVNHQLMHKYEIPEVYNYVKNSIIRTMREVDRISKYVLLRYHYRCHKDIIGFSNRKYYNNQLIVDEKKQFGNQALFHLNVETFKKDEVVTNIRNYSPEEIKAILNDLKSSNTNESVGIITPFRNQANMILEMVRSEGLQNVDVGTVHTFQGDEKDKIYFSMAINRRTSEKAFDWVKNNEELINVAITRAKNKFVLVGDFAEVEKRSTTSNDLYELGLYVKKNGREVALTEVNGSTKINYRQYNTNAEKELLETLSHILSTKDRYKVEKQVKMDTLLAKYDKDYFDFYTKSVFDFVIFKQLANDDIPCLVVELDGEEHQTRAKSKINDAKKEKICRENNIKLIRIKNHEVRRYMFIKDLLMSTNLFN